MILLLLSLLLLCGCLVGLVKLLNSMLGARVKTIISDHVNKVRSCSVMHWILIKPVILPRTSRCGGWAG